MHKIPGSTLRSVFGTNHRVNVTSAMVKNLSLWLTKYELYKEHPLALNSPYLGLHDMFFIRDVHQPQIFDILETDMRDFAKSITTVSTLDLSHKVKSDMVNLAVIWFSHLAHVSHLTEAQKHEFCFSLLKIMHYKFFTSLVTHRFDYGANEDIMRATIESLDKKSDIVIYGTWKKVIEIRCEEMLALTKKLDKSTKIAQSTYTAFHDFKEDEDIFYVITDAQTRFRDKIQLITNRFHLLKEQNETIGSYESVTTINGEKLVKDTSGSLMNMVNNLSNDILSSAQFIDTEYINFLCNMNKELKPYMFRSLLDYFTNISVTQAKTGRLDRTAMIKNEEIITGHRLLISEIVQVTYRHCINLGTNMRNKLEILRVAGNIYRNSQIQDEHVMRIKRSVEYFIDRFPNTRRENTRLALKINFIVYIILLSFKYI